ncbi:dienelactone hydrolase family protein [Marinivivus vitaminiproducens]|uniref:dienelactone hydrolase family protein n=1 Tax=Marinivivus vitaminiproducens TaxID=3035935 RepID=UPI0027A888E0|nr:dienelactone hydrolase family protein [Geminicoccaceae bacterium SCSIO 64248]
MNVEVQDGTFQAYLSRPDRAPAPAVVVVQEILGVNADIRAACDALAGAGFLAVAPDLFWRDAPGLDLDARNAAEWQRGLALYRSYDFDRGVGDIAATIAAARTLEGGSGAVGVMGFCLGGLLAFLTAARTPVDAAVGYYGAGTERYLDEADGIARPLMLHLGEEDEFIATDARERIRSALAGRPHATVHSYPGCAHAFARHGGAHFDADAARIANDRTEAFFDRHLRR